MTNNVAISLDDITKVYQLYDKPQDRFKEALNPFKKSYHHDFYAVRNVSFEIKKGETVGIVGKNGAGKSTLLKMITGVLTPTSGTIFVQGKIASLLELGAGFNPEMTGLENIYLNGTLMGYNKREVDSKVGSIIEFAGIGEFIYQPVKSYSSGMFARLAFSVAINVDPDILIIDEALSVGDFLFQHKCMNKFKEFQKRQKTIIFVSHSTQQIIQACSRALLIHEGKLYDDSYDVEAVTHHYERLLRNIKVDETPTLPDDIAYDFDVTPNTHVNEHRMGTHAAIIRDVKIIKNEKVISLAALNSGDKVKLIYIVLSTREFQSVVLGTSIKNVKGEVLWGDNTLAMSEEVILKKGVNQISFEFDLNIVPGEYLMYAGLADISSQDRVELDQRWPLEKINILSMRNMAEGVIYAPSLIDVKHIA